CADAAGETGKVLVLENTPLDEDSAPDTEGDLRMLCYVRGRERSLTQLAGLAGPAGLQITSAPPAGPHTLIELSPGPRPALLGDIRESVAELSRTGAVVLTKEEALGLIPDQ